MTGKEHIIPISLLALGVYLYTGSATMTGGFLIYSAMMIIIFK